MIDTKRLRLLWAGAGDDSEWSVEAHGVDKCAYVLNQDGDVVAQVYGNPAHLAGRFERAAFIAAARTAVPELLDELDRLRARVAKLEAVADAARDVREVWEGALCIIAPPCGNCRACRLDAAVLALADGGE